MMYSKTLIPHRLRAFSLAELLLSMGLFAMLVTSVAVFANDSFRSTLNSSSKVVATQYIQEMQNAILLNKDSLWSTIVMNTGTGDKHFVYTAGTYQMVDGQEIKGNIILKTSIQTVSRDVGGNIVETGGVVDLHTRAIVTTGTWVDFLGLTNTVSSTQYVSDWNTLKFTDTLTTDFNQGTFTDTLVANTAGGEVTMENVVFADWCKPETTLTSYDLPGQGIAKTIYATPGNIYMGTGSNSSGVSFAKLRFVPSDPPVVTQLGLFDGYKTNAIFSDGTYAYLATQTLSKEIVIVSIATTPYTERGYFTATENTQGYGIYVNDTVGIMATSNKLYSFDLTTKVGSRPKKSSLTLDGTVVDMFARGNYVYLALSNSQTELQIVDITNPNAMVSVGSIDLNNAAAKTVFVNEAGNRAYIGTGAQASQAEFFIIDVTSKTGSKYPFSSYETNGMSPVDITVPVDSQRAIVVGSGGTLQYQVVSLENESSPVRCGGLSLATAPKAVFSMVETNGNAYSYIVNGDNTSELKIIRGGAGGGNGQGVGYGQLGQFISKIFNTTSLTSSFYTLQWGGSVPAATEIKLQVRTSNVSTMSGAIWVGPDGTSATYFTLQQITALPLSLSGNQYIQYKVDFISNDQINTAIFNQLEFTYQK